MARQQIDENTRKRGARLAQLIRSARRRQNLTQEELASKAGVKLDTLRSIEGSRVRTPNVFLIADLAKELGGDLNEWLK